MKISIMKILIVLTFLCAFSLVSSAQEQRVRFASGKSSATLKGSLAAKGKRSYVLGAKADQCMQVLVKSGNKKVTVDVGGNDLGSGETIPLRSTDDYIITIHNGGSTTNFTLSIIIKNKSCE